MSAGTISFFENHRNLPQHNALHQNMDVLNCRADANSIRDQSPKTAGYKKNRAQLLYHKMKTSPNNKPSDSPLTKSKFARKPAPNNPLFLGKNNGDSPLVLATSPKSSSPSKRYKRYKGVFDEFFYERCKRYLNSCNLYIVDLEESDFKNKSSSIPLAARTKSCDIEIVQTKKEKCNTISKEVNESSLLKRRISLGTLNLTGLQAPRTNQFVIKPQKCESCEIIEEISTPSSGFNKPKKSAIVESPEKNLKNSVSPGKKPSILRN